MRDSAPVWTIILAVSEDRLNDQVNYNSGDLDRMISEDVYVQSRDPRSHFSKTLEIL